MGALMIENAFSEELIHRLVYENPVQFLSQSSRFRIKPGVASEFVGSR